MRFKSFESRGLKALKRRKSISCIAFDSGSNLLAILYKDGSRHSSDELYSKSIEDDFTTLSISLGVQKEVHMHSNNADADFRFDSAPISSPTLGSTSTPTWGFSASDSTSSLVSLYDEDSYYTGVVDYDIGSKFDSKLFSIITNSVCSLIKSKLNMLEDDEKLNDAKINKMSRDLCQSLEKVYVHPSTNIVQEGGVADKVFIVEEGELIVSLQGEPIRKLQKNTIFGDIAVLANSPRTASVSSITSCWLWFLKKQKLEDLCNSYVKVY